MESGRAILCCIWKVDDLLPEIMRSKGAHLLVQYPGKLVRKSKSMCAVTVGHLKTILQEKRLT